MPLQGCRCLGFGAKNGRALLKTINSRLNSLLFQKNPFTFAKVNMCENI